MKPIMVFLDGLTYLPAFRTITDNSLAVEYPPQPRCNVDGPQDRLQAQSGHQSLCDFNNDNPGPDHPFGIPEWMISYGSVTFVQTGLNASQLKLKR